MGTCSGWRTLTVVCLTVALAALARGAGAQTSAAAGSSPVNRSIAVVPLRNLSGDAADEWIGEGIAETLETDLEAHTSFSVMSHDLVADAISRRGRGTSDDDSVWLEIGRRAGAGWLVSGAYQRLGAQLRITARLVDLATGEVARSAKVDGALTDLFVLQDRLSAELTVGAPGVALSDGRRADLDATAPAGEPGVVSAVFGDAEPGAVPPDVVAAPSTTNTGGVAFLNTIDGPPPPIPLRGDEPRRERPHDRPCHSAHRTGAARRAAR